jgi:hypothetical protein
MPLDRELQLPPKTISVGGIRHDLSHSLLKLRDVKALVARELRTAHELLGIVPKVNPLRMFAADYVVPDSKVPHATIGAFDRSI